MTIGVDTFVGERLTEAREARGILTQSSLAELLDVSKNSISLYENNKGKPRPEMLAEIAKLLKLKESFFLTPLSPQNLKPIFWRSRHVTTQDKRTVAKRRFGWTKWIVDSYIKEFLDMPKLNIPSRKDIGVPDKFDELTDSQIESIALRCREYWGFRTTPIENMSTLLENNGVLISYGELNSERLDAFSNESEYDSSYHIFLGTDKRSALRSRYDAAHELGHLILHSHISSSSFSRTHGLVEHQAHRFAGAFLMPLQSFKKDVWMTSIEALKMLRDRWKVSVGAMIHRCEDIGLFGEADTSRLWNRYKRNWKDIEDDNFEFETPQLVKRSIDTLVNAGVRTKGQVLHDLPFMQRDIENLLNLPEGYFDEDFGQLKQFPTVKKNYDEQDLKGGELIEFDFRKNG